MWTRAICLRTWVLLGPSLGGEHAERVTREETSLIAVRIGYLIECHSTAPNSHLACSSAAVESPWKVSVMTVQVSSQ